MRRSHLAPLAVVAVTFSACGMVNWNADPAPPIVQFEVWNRTLDDVFLIDGDGRLISVPACGHADAAPLAGASAELRMDAGRIAMIESRPVGNPQFLVVVAAVGASTPMQERPVSLPICAGHPTVVPGA